MAVDYATVIRPLYDMPWKGSTMGLEIDKLLGHGGPDAFGVLRWSNKETFEAYEGARMGGTPEQIATLIRTNRKQGFYDVLIRR